VPRNKNNHDLRRKKKKRLIIVTVILPIILVIGFLSYTIGGFYVHRQSFNLAIEAKETPTTDDMTRLERLATRTALSKSRLVGRHKSPTFTNYTWAGSIT